MTKLTPVVRRLAAFGVLISAAAIAFAWTPLAGRGSTPRGMTGWPLYERFCLACHGADGDGRGPAAGFTNPRPRDLTRGEYAWGGARDDLRLLLRSGAPGTSMPAFALPDAELDQLVDVVLAFAPAKSLAPIAPLTAAPAPDPARGAALWVDKGCTSCHGPTGTGDSVVASGRGPKPFDLTRGIHRPHAPGDRRRATALSIANGVGGTAMPGFAGAITDAELWALADHVESLAKRPPDDRRALSKAAIELDRNTTKLGVGYWPGGTDLDEAALFGMKLAPQGPPPASLGPAQASLASQQCGRCHAKQVREWTPSVHHGATSPGLAAQMFALSPAAKASCLRCHAPLPDQPYADAVGCATCHVRGWTRHGPEKVAPSLVPLPGYPLKTLGIYERADFCLPCHQLPPRTEVNARPLLDTYREWLEGPYMKRGVQCQHCHMPNREHTFLGIHDPTTFRQGLTVTATARGGANRVDLVAKLANAGAGHFLPTTPTPAVWVTLELLDATGRVVAGATDRVRIGRHIEYVNNRWVEHADTRIPPGATTTLARAWTGTKTATHARITVEVHPDEYYERLYEQRLKGQLPAERRRLYEAALAKGRANHYIATTLDVPVTQ